MSDLQYQPLAEPAQLPEGAPETITVDKWLPQLPAPPRAHRSVAALVSGLTAPPFIAQGSAAAPVGWRPSYPDSPPSPRRRAAPSALSFVPLVTAAAPDYVAPTFPDWLQRPRSIAPFVWGQPMFGVLVGVPVLSWVGGFPDMIERSKRPHAAQSPALAWEPSTPAPAPVPDHWRPVYPDRMPGAPRRVPDAFAWHPEAPAAPVVPDHFRPIYPDRHPRTPVTPPSQHVEPALVPDVTQPVTPLSWRPIFPDLIWRARRPQPTTGAAPVREPDPNPSTVTTVALLASYAPTVALLASYQIAIALLGGVMAIKSHIERDDYLFVGEDKELEFEVFTSAGVAGGTMQNVASFAMEWLLLRNDQDAHEPILRKATGGSGISVTGSFNSVRASNTQRAVVAIADTDTDHLKPGTYRHVLRRTDAGFEQVLSFGTVVLQQIGGR